MHLSSKRKLLNFLLFAACFISVLSNSSCNSSKKVPYFQDVPDSLNAHKEISTTEYAEAPIKATDQLFISVETIDQRNIAVGSDKAGSTNSPQEGYVVDQNGYVEVPLVGRLKVAGHTTSEIKEMVRTAASKYFVDPIVNVRILNYYISIQGEVNHPGRMNVFQEKVSVMDAISFAGDLTITARRDNILLSREENGKRIFVRLNLNSTDIFKSPYYYMRNGDILYVEPIKAKSRIATSDTSKDRFITLGTALLSLVNIVVTLASLNR